MIEILLPFPDPKLNPNNSKGTHWAVTTKARKQARADAYLVTKMTRPPKAPDGNVQMNIVFVQPDKRRRDRDNLLAAMKPALDGIADALGIDDSRFEPVVLRREYGKAPGQVRVIVWL
jgi:crossover junction endodeoxyribonuclease RusA